LSSLQCAQVERVGDILLKLGKEGQSSEESDSDSGLIITVPHYRHRIITDMMVELDSSVKAVKKAHALQLGKKSL
ncbi:hypothetical protein F5050DRAFT_1542917, partial [Lentinula boryana]